MEHLKGSTKRLKRVIICRSIGNLFFVAWGIIFIWAWLSKDNFHQLPSYKLLTNSLLTIAFGLFTTASLIGKGKKNATFWLYALATVVGLCLTIDKIINYMH